MACTSWAGILAAQVLPGTQDAVPETTAKALPIPDPAQLKPGWWDYLATDQPALDERVAALLRQAGSSSAALPAELSAEASEAMEILSISLTALPSLLAAEPEELPEAPQPREHYTITELIKLDRELRDFQADLDERRGSISVTERAIRDSQGQMETDFAAYLEQARTVPERTLAGLRIMASSGEIAIAQAEIRLLRREADLLSARVRELKVLRNAGMSRIVPDPERQPDDIQALLLKNREKLEEARRAILRSRAHRSELSRRADTPESELLLADLQVIAAIVEENVVRTRIALQETELDWLAISAGKLDSATARALDRRLEERQRALRSTDRNADDWMNEVQRLIAVGLRARNNEAGNEDAQDPRDMFERGPKAVSRINRLRTLQADIRFALTAAMDLLTDTSTARGWIQRNVIKRVGTMLKQADDLLSTSLFTIGDAPVTAWGLLRVLLIMTFAIVLSRVFRHLLARFGERGQAGASAGMYTVGRLLHYVLIAAGLMIGLSAIGLDFSQLALVAGALSIGIGFGLQSIVNNFVSGLMILFERSLKIGDVVELDSGVRGIVREINVRSTLVSTNDAVDIIVPNSEFVSGKVINYTLREPHHRIHVPFGVAYGSDKELVRSVVVEAAKSVSYTHLREDRQPDVWLVNFGESSLDFELVVWINLGGVTRRGAVIATYLWEIETALKKHGIEIPFPQRDVHLRVLGEVPVKSGATADRLDTR